ncbi:MAG: MFS transporter [Desulfobacterota bacterium]|nr:MFS transporter [Thermodesulfobacteriota bacterium]
MSRDLIAIFIAVFLLAFGMSFAAPLIPLLLKDLGASPGSIGQIQTVYFISFTLTTSLLGRWISHAGCKRLIIAGLGLFGAAVFAMAFAPTAWWFYIIRIIQGIGSALLFAPTEAAINLLSPPDKRSSNMGIYGLVFGAGFAAGPALSTGLYVVNRAVPFYIAALSCAGAMVVLQAWFHEQPVPIKKAAWGFSKLVSVLKIPLAAATCYAFVEIAVGAFLSLYLDAFGIRGARLGMVFTLFALGGIISPFPAGYVADKLGRRPVLKLCGVLLVCVTAGFIVAREYITIAGLALCLGMVAGILYPVSLSLIAELVPPEQMGAANASFSFFYGIGSIAGPLVTGWVLDLSSITSLFYPITAAALAFLIITLFGREPSRQ